MKKMKVFLVLLVLLFLGAAVFAQSVPYWTSNAIGSSPISPDRNRAWSGSGSSSDPWYNVFLNGGIEIRVMRGSYQNIVVMVKSNLDYSVWVNVKTRSANGSKTGYNTVYMPVSRYDTTITPPPSISNSDGFSGITIVVLRTQDQNGISHHYSLPDSFRNRTW